MAANLALACDKLRSMLFGHFDRSADVQYTGMVK